MERSTKNIKINKASAGLGLKLVGGLSEDGNFDGIYVRDIISGGAVDQNNCLKIGDQLIAVNDIKMENFSLSRAVNFLRRASFSDSVYLTVSSDQIAKKGFKEQMKKHHSVKNRSSSLDSAKSISEQMIQSKDVIENQVSINKTTAGLGLRFEEIKFLTDYQFSIPILRVSTLSPNGDVAHEGSIKIGDYLTAINHQSVIGCLTLVQVHSLLLREKLRVTTSVSFSYIPHKTPLNEVGRFHLMKIVEAGKYMDKFPQIERFVACQKKENESADEKMHNEPNEKENSKKLEEKKDVRNKFLLPSTTRIQIEKFEESLSNLQINLSEEKLKRFRQCLETDVDNTSSYQEFMSVFLDLFANELLNQKKKVEDKTDLEVENINSDLKYGLLEEEISRLNSKIDEMKRKNEILMKELEKNYELQSKNEKEVNNAQQNYKNELNQMRSDYDEVIRGLENELINYKNGETNLPYLNNGQEKKLTSKLEELNQIRLNHEEKVEKLLVFINKIVQSDVKSFSKYQKTDEAIKVLERFAEEAEELYLNVRSEMQDEEIANFQNLPHTISEVTDFQDDFSNLSVDFLSPKPADNDLHTYKKKKKTSNNPPKSLNSSIGSLTSRISSNSSQNTENISAVKMRLI